MPRRDPAARREEVAAAVWRLIRRDGMEAVSVRRVAREAGLSTGSLRHLFATQSALVAFSMRLVLDRASARVRALPQPEEPRALVEALLGEVLPLDAERRAESEVWLAFCGRALVEPELRALRDELDAALSGL